MLSGLREYEVRSNPYLAQVQSNKYRNNSYEKERQETAMSDFDRKDWDQDSKGPENI